MQLIVNVPDGSPLADTVNGWQDGQNYSLTVTQTGTGQFDLVDAGPETENPEEQSAPTEEPEGESMGGKMPMHKNPAIAIVIGGGKSKK